MLNGLYWKYWYGIEEPGYELEADEAVLYENKLIGRPRLRQVFIMTPQNMSSADDFQVIVMNKIINRRKS